jgi:hypothetical protein
LISVTDLCSDPPLANDEKAAMICFTRMFLETVLKDEHKYVKINIYLKDLSDALFKHITGSIEYVGQNVFNIVIYSQARKDMVGALAHELIHVKQYLEGGFFIHREKNSVYWQGQFYMQLSDLILFHKNTDRGRYDNLPWEREANTMLLAVSELVNQKFLKLCDDDPGLKKYMKYAQKCSSYNLDISYEFYDNEIGDEGC